MGKIIEIKYGMLEGIEEGGLYKYLGIPYAKPPIGDLKWKRAKECEPWQGVLKADHYSEVAPQFNNNKWQGKLEDCLTINVVTPKDINETDKLPVLVWIHGGGFSIGGCNDSLSTGERFAKEGCIFVSLQYRLSVFGFYEFGTYKGCEEVETNRGLSDMVLALKWVHENIEAFGGNPQNVTIFGESAGGTAMTTLMAVPSVEGYFQKVIAESSLCELVDTPKSQRRNVDLFLKAMGWSDDGGLMSRLNETDPYKLVEGHLYQESHMQYEYPGILGAGPVIDDLLPLRPIEAMKAGYSKGVMLIIGTNLNEGTMFVRPEGTILPNSWELIRKGFELNGLEEKYSEFETYYKELEVEQIYGNAFVKFATDIAWEVPSIRFARAHAPYADTYMYRFEYVSDFSKETGMLASHAFELPCVFGVKEHEFARMLFKGEKEEDANAIIDEIHGIWVEFAKTGDTGISDWGKFEGEIPSVRIFDKKCRTQKLDRTKMMQLWEDIVFYKD